MAFPGKRIADALNLDRGQGAICDAISAFRRKAVQSLAAAGFLADDESVVMTGKCGYQIHPDLAVEDLKDATGPSDTAPDEPRAADRQEWFIAELAKGRKLRRQDLEKHFGISTATAKRDLREIWPRIEFRGTGAAGYYAAKPGRKPPKPS